MNIERLEIKLNECREDLKEKSQRFTSQRFTIEDRAKWKKQHHKCLEIEREIAMLGGKETALPIEWSVKWDVGAPLPHVMSGSGRTFLIYYAFRTKLDHDKRLVKIVDDINEGTDSIALVEFLTCYDFRFGGPNDEVHQGYPLYGKGLELYQAHTVSNSKWLESVEKTNQIHSGYNPDSWRRYKHFLLLFHDELFECLAKSYYIEIYGRSMDDVLEIALNRMIGREKSMPK